MLSQILTEFDNTTRGLCVEEIAQKLGRNPRVVAGALDLLVNMGKLDVIEVGVCDSCPVRDICSAITNPKRIYVISANKP
jgi:hypothetical protein